MRINDIQNIITIDQYKNFGKAANALFVSQPALSQSVQRIEAELGCKLLERQHQKVTLTPEGEIFCREGSVILTRYARMLEAIGKQSSKREQIVVGASPLYSKHYFPLIYSEFREKFPQVELHLVEYFSLDLIKMMDNQELDFVILPASLVGNGLRFYKLYQEEIVLVMPGKFHEDHSTAFYSKNGKEYVDLSAMGNESFLGYKPNNTMQTVTMDFCRDAGFAPQIVFYSSSPEIVCSMAQCGMGIGFVPSLVQAYYPSETTHLAYCSIENQQAFRDYVIAFKRSRMLSDAGKSFIELSKHLHSVADFPISDMKLEL